MLIIFAVLTLYLATIHAEELPILIEEHFEDTDLEGWTMTDSKAWRLSDSDKGKSLDLFQKSTYRPAVRSPYAIALVNKPEVADFVLDVRVKSTVKDYDHRDLCIIFGYVDPAHFYYVHLGKKADPHAHSIFRVNGKPRVSIASERTEGTPWTDDWHQVRIRREVATGNITVWFDDMNNPIMQGVDTIFPKGKIGLGSFDDTGMFDNLIVRGTSSAAP